MTTRREREKSNKYNYRNFIASDLVIPLIPAVIYLIWSIFQTKRKY